MQVRRAAERHRQIGLGGVVQERFRELLKFVEARVPQLLPFRVAGTARLSALTFRAEYFPFSWKERRKKKNSH